MITPREFLKVEKCNICKNFGYLEYIVETEEQMQYTGLPKGETYVEKCGECYRDNKRKVRYYNTEGLDPNLKFIEIKDYVEDSTSLGKDEVEVETTLTSIMVMQRLLSDPKTFIEECSFLILEGRRLSGKSAMAHMICREAMLKHGYVFKNTTIDEYVIAASNLKSGNYLIVDGVKLFDAQDYIDPNILVIENFDFVDEYMRFGDMKRINLVNILNQRANQEDKLTILTTRESLETVFKSSSSKGVPRDFARVINKNLKRLVFNGDFKKGKQKTKGQSKATKKAKGSGRVKPK